MQRQRRLWLALLALLFGLFVTPRHGVAANDIDVVTLDGDGPDKPLSLGTAFYLQGPVETDAAEVYVVIVRTSWPLFNLWSADRDRCSDLQKLGAPSGLATVKRHTSTHDLWPGEPGKEGPDANKGKDTDWDEPALVIGPWTRKDASQNQYKLLIPSDSLFRQGASYCLLSYAKEPTTAQDIVTFRKRLLDLGEGVKSCVGTDDPDGRRDTCLGTEGEKLTAKLAEDFKDVPKDKAEDAWRAVRGAGVTGADGKKTGLVNAVLTFSLKSTQLTNLTGTWAPFGAHGPDGTLYPVPTPPPPPAAAKAEPAAPKLPKGKPQPALVAPVPPKDESFGLPFMLADRLAAKGELTRLDPGYSFANSVVTRLGLKDDHTFSVEVTQPAAASGGRPVLAVKPLAVAASAVLLPDSQLSVEDALRFADGFIRIKGEYVAIRALGTGLLADLKPTASGDFSQAQLDALASVRSAFEAWDTFLQQVAHARETPGDERNSARALRAIVANVLPETVQGLRKRVKDVTTKLQEYELAEKVWNASPQLIREQANSSWKGLVAYRVDRHAGLTQQRWFDTYFTPVVGRAAVFGRSATFGEWYTGVQLFAYANAVNEPMWSNGSDDFRRFVGVELAAIPKTSSFGPNGRFSRDEDVGLAWMIGGVIQPLPYTTLSAGGVWISERESRLAAENPNAHFSWYIGLAVQANVPGIVRTIANPTTATANGAH